ncbi:MAG: hypothetical protein ACRENE_15640, partial [Polyangiaceae bacterium]
MGRWAGSVAGGLLAITLIATARCGGSSPSSSAPPEHACIPGASVACVGPGSCAGFQVCGATGASLGSCICGPGASSGASSSSGTSSGSSGGSATSGSSGAGADSGLADSATEVGADGSDAAPSGACRGGVYAGSFGGLYSSHLTLIGANIPLTGNVSLTLMQLGSSQQTCAVDGDSGPCDDFLSIRAGVVQGVADGAFPFVCTLTGTLDCRDKKLADGWIECTYCIGPLNDGGTSCTLGGGGDSGLTGSGGRFAGPLASDYFETSTGGDGGAGAIDGGGSGPPALGTVPPPLRADASSYDPGTWNGAEALGGYSGSGPLPDGGALGDY